MDTFTQINREVPEVAVNYLNSQAVGGGWGGWGRGCCTIPPFSFSSDYRKDLCLKDPRCSCVSGALVGIAPFPMGPSPLPKFTEASSACGGIPAGQTRDTACCLGAGYWTGPVRRRIQAPVPAGTTRPGRLPGSGAAAACPKPGLAAALRAARTNGAVLENPVRPECAPKAANTARAAPSVSQPFPPRPEPPPHGPR